MFNSNTLSNYKTELAHRKALSDEWECGLASIDYPNTWLNVKSDQTYGMAYFGSERALDGRIIFRARLYGLPYRLEMGRYVSATSLIEQLNTGLADTNNFLRTENKILSFPRLRINQNQFSLHITNGSTLISEEGKDLVPVMTKELAEMLGVEINKNNLVAEWDTFYAVEYTHPEGSIDITAGIRSLYAYTDIIDYNLVGNSMAQLLRVVEIPNGLMFGEQVKITYDKPYYFPVKDNVIHIIETCLKDDTKEDIEFLFGKVVFVLHFRKRNNRHG